MSFLYPFNISVQRAGAVTQTQDGAVQTTVTIAASVPASIQLKRDKGFSAPVGFQGAQTNTSGPMPAWMVYVAASSPQILDGDMITDLATPSRVFKVDAAEFTPLGWQLACTPYKPNA